MPRTARQRRGQKTAQLVAEYLQSLAPGAKATPSAYSGNDIQNVPWDVEVKAPREEAWSHVKAGAGHLAVPVPACCAECGGRIRPRRFSPLAALRQAAGRRKPGHVLPPMVVMRPDGTGDASVGEFVVMRRFEDDRAILAEMLELRRRVQVLEQIAQESADRYLEEARLRTEVLAAEDREGRASMGDDW